MEVNNLSAESISATYFFVSFFVLVAWSLIWGFATRSIVINRGYDEEGTTWFWFGFFFSLIALIIALTKPEKKRENDFTSSYSPQVEYNTRLSNQRTLNEGGWKCDCGSVNSYYVTSCGCGRTKAQILQKEREANRQAEVASGKSPAEQIKELKQLLDEGIITQDEFDYKKKQLLEL
ncbi:MAG: SHOCT domain-containing protein [Oscillospiraceae bacterium]|nr:SHOCT domain-containing protein [Oscillospiraceae bacterium]